MQRAPEAPEMAPPRLMARAVRAGREYGLPRWSDKVRRAFPVRPSPSPRASGYPVRPSPSPRASGWTGQQVSAAQGDRRLEDRRPERMAADRAGVSWGVSWVRRTCGTRHRPAPDRCGFAESSGRDEEGIARAMIRRPCAVHRDQRHESGHRARADSRAGRCRAEGHDAKCRRAVRRSGRARREGASMIAASATLWAGKRQGPWQICTGFRQRRALLQGLRMVSSCLP